MTTLSPWGIAADVLDPPVWEPDGRPPLEPHQKPPAGRWDLWVLQAGRGCVSAGTQVRDPVNAVDVAVEDRHEPGWVQTLDGPALASASYPKGSAPLFRVETETGDVCVVTAQHRFLMPTGWVHLEGMKIGDEIASAAPSGLLGDGPRSTGTALGSRVDCRWCRRCGDPQPRPPREIGHSRLRSQVGAQPHSGDPSVATDGPGRERVHSLPCPRCVHSGRSGCALGEPSPAVVECRRQSCARVQPLPVCRALPLSLGPSAPRGEALSLDLAERRIEEHDPAACQCRSVGPRPEPSTAARSFHRTPHTGRRALPASRRLDTPPGSEHLASATWTRIVSISPNGTGLFYDLTVPGAEHYLADGIWHHNSGKTEAMARYFAAWMRAHPGHRGRIIAPTFGDAVESCIDGPSGLKAIDPEITWLPSAPGGAKVVWPNGSETLVLGIPTPRDIDRLRAGGNRHIDWWEEMAAIPQLGSPKAEDGKIGGAWDQAQLGLRMGDHPHSIASTTPRTTSAYRHILKESGVALTRAKMEDNPHNPAKWVAQMRDRYAGTRLGRQELAGELLEDVEGALWKLHWIDLARVQSIDVPVSRRVIGVDPGEGLHAYTLAASALDHRLYVEDARLVRKSAHGFAAQMVALASARDAEILIERNHGGSWLQEVFEGAMREKGVMVPIRTIWASDGKRVRAAPVAGLYEQAEAGMVRVCHVGHHPELEESMTTWDGSGDSPHLIDSAVWAISDLSKGMAGPSDTAAVAPWSAGSVPGGAVAWGGDVR